MDVIWLLEYEDAKLSAIFITQNMLKERGENKENRLYNIIFINLIL